MAGEQAVAHREARMRTSSSIWPRGCEIIDGLKQLMPLGLSEVSKRFGIAAIELARSMDKVLAKRAAEEPSAKAWNYVKVKATPVTVKRPGLAAIHA